MKSAASHKNKIIQILIMVAYAIYFAVLRVFIVPFGDDQFWWGPKGKYLLDHHFFTLKDQTVIGGSSNGRYLSNITMIFSMHHPIVTYLLFGIMSALLVWLIYRLVGGRPIIFLLALVFPFTLSRPFMTGTWFWYSAFINYITGIIFVMAFLVILKRDFIEKRDCTGIWVSVICAVIGILGGLVVEHITLYQIAIAIFIVWYSYTRRRELELYQLTYLFGAIIGAIIMFSNRTYWSHTDYRSSTLSLTAIRHVYVQSSHFWMISLNLFIIIVITSAVFILLIQKKHKQLADLVMMSLSVVFAAYYLVANIVFKRLFSLDSFLPLVSHKFAAFDSIVSILFILYMFLAVAFVTTNNKLRTKLVFCLFSFIFLIAPFLIIIQPNSSREFFDGVVFLYIFGLLLVKQIKFSRKWISVGLSSCFEFVLVIAASVVMYQNIVDHDNYIDDDNHVEAVGAIAPQNRVKYPQYFPNGDAYGTTEGAIYWRKYKQYTFLERLWNFQYTQR